MLGKIGKFLDTHFLLFIGVLFFLVAVSLIALFLLLKGMRPPDPTPTAIVSAVTLTPGTPTISVTPTPTITPTQTFTPTPTQTSTPTPTQTITPTTSSIIPPPAEEARYEGICLDDQPSLNTKWGVTERKHFTVISTTLRFPEFPVFKEWCSKTIHENGFLTTKTQNAVIKISLTGEGVSFPVRSLLLMATIDDTSRNSADNQNPIARITYHYKGDKHSHTSIYPEHDIANWNYHEHFLKVDKPNVYRVWSGLAVEHTLAAQVFVLVLDPQKPDNFDFPTLSSDLRMPLDSLEIEYLGGSFGLDLYGFMASNISPEQIYNQVQEMKTRIKAKATPLCFDGDQRTATVMIGDNSREQTYSSVVDAGRDYYDATKFGGCNISYDIGDELPDALLPSLPRRPLVPFNIGPMIYESRPEGSPASSDPIITITLSHPQELANVYLALSGRNLCNGDMLAASRENFPTLGSIAIYVDSTKPPVVTKLITVGENIRQGRSGIRYTCPITDSRGVKLLDDARVMGNTPTSYEGFPLAAKPTHDTRNPNGTPESVALWVDVISIPIRPEAGVITKIVLTDTTRPVPNESGGDSDDSRDTVDFTDPYLVLYGVTIEPRPPEPRPPPPPAGPER